MKPVGELIKERRKRKGWSQTVLGDLVGMSAATIHRLEYGEKIPTDQELNLLAETLGVAGETLYEACEVTRNARQNRKLPASSYRTEWDYAHPSTYAGRVWIQVTPTPENRHLPHDYQIRWGAWEYSGQLAFGDRTSLYLAHYKHNDGEGLPILFTISYPCYVVFGKETLMTEDKIDITLGWKRVEPYSLTQLWRMSLSHILLGLRQRLTRINRTLS